MLPEFFVQTEYNTGKTERKKVKFLLGLSYGIKVASLAFVVLAAIFTMYYLIGFALTYAVGIFFRQLVLQRVEAFEYFLVKDKLKFSVRNNFHTQKTVAEIPLENVKSIEAIKPEIIDKEDIYIVPEGKSIIKIRYIENNVTKNLYFAPSKYMLALIHKRRKL